jgi:hypothetical protein
MSKDLVKKPEGGSLALPDYLRNEEALGVEELGQFVTPPRLKVVQPLSDRDTFLTKFNPGDVVAVPQLLLVSPMKDPADDAVASDNGVPFHFVPIFFFVEWCLWNPLKARGTLPCIRERSLDPKSPLAVKSRNPATWTEPCPEMPDEAIRYTEHLNFICMLRDKPELGNVPVVLPFSRSEHRCGSNLASLIKMRHAPIFACQFEASVGFRQNAKGQWYGIDVTNPSTKSGVTGFVQDEEAYEGFRNLHEELKDAHEKSKIVVSYEDEETAVEGEVLDTDNDESKEF